METNVSSSSEPSIVIGRSGLERWEEVSLSSASISASRVSAGCGGRAASILARRLDEVTWDNDGDRPRFCAGVWVVEPRAAWARIRCEGEGSAAADMLGKLEGPGADTG